MRQLGRQDRRLHAIEPAVDALDMMLVFDEPAVTREHRDVLGQCVVIGDDGAGVAYRPKIIARIERIGCDIAKAADLPPFVARQMRLRAILDHP
jgi:hypothetical protein